MLTPSTSCSPATRRGFTLMEVTVASAALGLLTVGIVQATVALDTARQATLRSDYASRELDNLLERFIHRPWDEISQSTADRLEPGPQLAQQLPNVSLEAVVAELSEPLDAKRVTMQLRWRSHTRGHEHSSVLTAWAFRGEEDTP